MLGIGLFTRCETFLKKSFLYFASFNLVDLELFRLPLGITDQYLGKIFVICEFNVSVLLTLTIDVQVNNREHRFKIKSKIFASFMECHLFFIHNSWMNHGWLSMHGQPMLRLIIHALARLPNGFQKSHVYFRLLSFAAFTEIEETYRRLQPLLLPEPNFLCPTCNEYRTTYKPPLRASLSKNFRGISLEKHRKL